MLSISFVLYGAPAIHGKVIAARRLECTVVLENEGINRSVVKAALYNPSLRGTPQFVGQ